MGSSPYMDQLFTLNIYQNNQLAGSSRTVYVSTSFLVTKNSDGSLSFDIAPTFAKLALTPIAAPSAPASGWYLYDDSADGRVKFMATSGNVLEIGTTSLNFASGVSSPSIGQDAIPGTGATSGQTLTLSTQAGQAQTGTNANNNGGDIQLNPGVAGTGGSGAPGSPGGVKFNVNGKLYQFLSTHADFASNAIGNLASANLVPASLTTPATGWQIGTDTSDNRLKAIDPTGRIVILSARMLLSNSKTLTANNTTANVPIFGITGTVRVTKLYGIVTTTIGANHTGSLFRSNDGTAQVNISSAAAVALSAAPVGSAITRSGLEATATGVALATAARVGDATTAGTTVFCEFIIVKKNGATTNIEYQYATTDAPTSGAIQFWIEYEPLSSDGAVAAV